MSNPLHFPYAVAPMIAVTHHFFRYLIRLIHPDVVLYTEMVASPALIHGPTNQLLHYDPIEHPLVLQLGGSDPALLANCSQIAAKRGFDAINLNLGCPSERVYAGEFGLCLMKQAHRVGDCLKAMQDSVSLPISAKIRTGVDDQDDYAFLSDFVEILSRTGLKEVIVHARKGWLEGLSPKENRSIPPLDYEKVYQLKRDFPYLRIGINGGIKTLSEAEAHLKQVDQVMLGRLIDNDPYWLAALDDQRSKSSSFQGRLTCFEQYLKYLSSLPEFSVSHALRPLMGLFHSQPLARIYRRTLSDLVIHQHELTPLKILKSLENLSTLLQKNSGN